MPRRRRDSLAGEWFWVDRWNESLACLLPLEARGLDREMRSQAWLRGARLPNDPDAIKRAVRATDDEWARCWPLVQPYWRVDGEWLVNDEQVDVYAQSIELREARSAAGKKGMRARWASKLKHIKKIGRDNTVNNTVNNKGDNKTITSVSGSKISLSTSNKLNRDAVPRARESSAVEGGDDFTFSRAEAPPPVSGRKRCASHVAPQACHRGVCVLPDIHDELIARMGGDPTLAHRRLLTFYADVMRDIPNTGPITESPFVFWRRHFAEHFENSVEPKKGQRGGPYVPDEDETRAELDRRRLKANMSSRRALPDER